jgi:DNA-binding GntR family transcriptional regulator
MKMAPLHRENMTSRIYREVKGRLMTGRLRPGQTITLRSLADNLGVSQTPVREALMQLVSERALTLSPGRSVNVPVLTEVQLQELRSIRIELESFAGRMAARNVTPALVKELARIHKVLAAARKRCDRDALLNANFEFHFALYSAADMPYLLSLIENLWVQTASYLTFMYQPPFPGLTGEHPHSVIVAALQRHDADAVIKEIRRDIEAHGEILMRVLRERRIVE